MPVMRSRARIPAVALPSRAALIPQPREENYHEETHRDPAYLVLTDRAVPYLLARVRWPDVAQAITAGRPDWLDDPGLFDLPYDASAVRVSFAQAASVAASWGVQLLAEPTDGAPSFIRRMPANWSDLSPAERRAFGIEFVGRRAPARQLRRLRSYQALVAAAPVTEADHDADASFTLGRPGWSATGPELDPDATDRFEIEEADRRRHVRLIVDGRAHIRRGPATISASLVDLSEGGLRCVQPDPLPVLAPGTTLDAPLLLEAKVIKSRICLNVPGRIIWRRSIEAKTHLGIAFGELPDSDAEGLRSLLAAAYSKRGS
jgi:hypothetical protein